MFVKVCCSLVFVTLNLLYLPPGILLLLLARLTDALRITTLYSHSLGPRLLRGYNALVLLAFNIRVCVQGDRAAASQSNLMLFTHASNSDAPAIAVSLPHGTKFTGVAKHSLLLVPVLGWFFRLGGIIPIRRGNLAQAITALEVAENSVRRGVTVGISPEGTRRRRPSVPDPEQNLLTFKKGPFHLIRKLHTEGLNRIVLASIIGSQRAWAGAFPVAGSRVVVRFSATVDLVKTAGSDEVDVLMTTARAAMLKEMQLLGGKAGSLDYAAAKSREITRGELLGMCGTTLGLGVLLWSLFLAKFLY